MNNKKLLDLSLEDINKHIIYAPNSSGKTRLSNKLKEKNDDVLLFTSESIEDLLAISGKTINVGVEAKYVVRNNDIVNELNKKKDFSIGKDIYGCTSAKALCDKSFIFGSSKLKKIGNFDICKSLAEFISKNKLDFELKNEEFGLYIDQNLKIDLFQKIINILSQTVVEAKTESKKSLISSDLFDALNFIFESIGYDSRCPLCGYDWGTNENLKNEINNKLKTYEISKDEISITIINQFNNFLEKCNANYEKMFFINKQNPYDFDNLSDNVKLIISILGAFAKHLLDKSNNINSVQLIKEYKKNEDTINKEKEQRLSKNDFENNISKYVQNIIVLPEGFIFLANDGTLKIKNENGNMVDPIKFLSESEKRRLCIAILFAEINSRNINFLILDDPADSNDDYYFDNLINLIIDFFNENSHLKWCILTHEVRVPYLFAIEEERLLFENINPGYLFYFYLPDPSNNNNSKPPLNLNDVSGEQIRIINEHEVVLFSNIFNNKPGYQTDSELALLASFNQCRGLYNELLKTHNIKSKMSKSLQKKLDLVVSSYEHYVFNHKLSAKMKDLYYLNFFAYRKGHINPCYKTNKNAQAFRYRNKFLISRKYSSIMCCNPLIKYILYTILRVLDCHFLFEMKLGEWAKKNIPSFSKSTFEATHTIGRKINYVRGLCLSGSPTLLTNFEKFDSLFSKSRKLLNDFSHSASMMFPPFFSVNPLDITRLENAILCLPK